MRALSPVEAAVAVAIAGSVLASTIPAFLDNLHASRLVEPISGLERIAAGATALAAGRAAEVAYPASVGLTPATVPRGERAVDPKGTWDHPTWQALDFALMVPHSYSFAFASSNAKGSASFRSWAHGDLDGDGTYSWFEISGYSRDGEAPAVLPLEMHREIE